MNTTVAAPKPDYFARLDPAVRGHFDGAMALRDFLQGAGSLTAAQRTLILHQSLVLMEQNYVHLALKRSMHAVDPVQRLKLLIQADALHRSDEPQAETDFHRQLTDVFTSVRDLHTNYLLPAPFSALQAFLPFMAESYFEGKQRRYLVSHVVPGFVHQTFCVGVELLSWNGIPIDRAVLNNANRYAGSNAEAHRARGEATLTSRVLRVMAPPDEAWVIVGYRHGDGAEAEIRLDWMVDAPVPLRASAAQGEVGAVDSGVSQGLDLEQHLRQRMRKALFAPKIVAQSAAACEKVARKAAFKPLESRLPDVFDARNLKHSTGAYGYLRIRTFAVNEEIFMQEFMRLLSAVSGDGLILDVRGNGGGLIMNGETILQLLTPRRIEPEPVQFACSALNLQICKRNNAESFVDLSPWVESMELALSTGAAYSAAFPITDPVACNAIGQRYFGPVVLIVDGLCYSTTDIFAAGFQDHGIGKVIGIDGNTGAGGANVWTHDLLCQLLPPDVSVYRALPGEAGMRVSMRRTLRVGKRAGTPVEELGVVPDLRYRMTRNDLLHSNVGLLAEAMATLADGPRRALQVKVCRAGDRALRVDVQALGMTRVDVYVDDRPVVSADLPCGRALDVATTGDAHALEVRGYDAGQMVGRLLVQQSDWLPGVGVTPDDSPEASPLVRRTRPVAPRRRAARAATPAPAPQTPTPH